MQCNIIGGQLFLDEEVSSDDEDLEFTDDLDNDPNWLPGDESSDSDDEFEKIEDTM